jgi:purine-binding chemotaxis protein CheW
MDGVGRMEAASVTADNSDKAGKYLTFQLGEEEYGLSLLRVREIIALMDITAVPLAPDYVRGVMNLRGKVIPVVDLRRKLNMPSTEDHERKCIIVVDVQQDGEISQMGVLVDSVSEVLYIGAAEIEGPPAINAGTSANYVSGMAKTKDSIKILLEVDNVLARVPVGAASTQPRTQDPPVDRTTH